MAKAYSLWIFDRQCNPIYHQDWSRIHYPSSHNPSHNTPTNSTSTASNFFQSSTTPTSNTAVNPGTNQRRPGQTLLPGVSRSVPDGGQQPVATAAAISDQRNDGLLPLDEEAKLVYGAVFSLRNMVRKLGGSHDNFNSYSTSSYTLSHFLTPTFHTFVLFTDPVSPPSRLPNSGSTGGGGIPGTAGMSLKGVLLQLWRGPWVENVMKNPLIRGLEREILDDGSSSDDDSDADDDDAETQDEHSKRATSEKREQSRKEARIRGIDSDALRTGIERDVLDEFTAKPQASTSTSTSTATTAQPSTSTSTSTSTSDSTSEPKAPTTATTGAEDDSGLEAEFDEEIFAKELEASMVNLMKTFGGAGSAGADNQSSKNQSAGAQTGQQQTGSEMNEEEMIKQFEAMMTEMGLGNENGILGGGAGGSASTQAAAASGSNPDSNPSSSRPTPANYQEALAATMSRLKASDASATNATSSNKGGANPLAGMFPGLENDEEMKKLMATLSGGDVGPDGESPEFAKVLENMMGELMGKEVLYEPMKELADKYQPFLSNPPRPLSAEDKLRFTKQAEIVKEVVALFEDPKFDNGTDEEKRKLKSQVGEKMNEMQECGAPPDEVAGEMPEGMEGIPGLDGSPENCSIM